MANERLSNICRLNRAVVGIGLFVFSTLGIQAGPPFITDDPEPVDYQHGEFYIASQDFQTSDGWSGTAPHIELNYGVITNVQLHLIAPLAYDAPKNGAARYGYGDTELGVKFRFLQETSLLPEAAVFPLAEAPTGDSSRGLGSGQWQAFLPLWLQKSFGHWTIYGGGGYGINPGAGNQNWGFGGAVLQCQVRDNVLVGGEIYHRTAMQTGGQDDTTDFQVYIAWQFTFGPEFFHSIARSF